MKRMFDLGVRLNYNESRDARIYWLAGAREQVLRGGRPVGLGGIKNHIDVGVREQIRSAQTPPVRALRFLAMRQAFELHADTVAYNSLPVPP